MEPTYYPTAYGLEEIQSICPISDDIEAWEVSVASHGGIMITLADAGFLSDEAREIGFVDRGYICFEEDCDFAVAVLEMEEEGLYRFPQHSYSCSKEEYLEAAYQVLQRFRPEYLESRGI